MAEKTIKKKKNRARLTRQIEKRKLFKIREIEKQRYIGNFITSRARLKTQFSSRNFKMLMSNNNQEIIARPTINIMTKNKKKKGKKNHICVGT